MWVLPSSSVYDVPLRAIFASFAVVAWAGSVFFAGGLAAGADFAPPGATTGAAVVQPPGAPTAYFVVWRVIDGKLDVIYTRPRDVVGATFEELLTMARGKYASGEGMR